MSVYLIYLIITCGELLCIHNNSPPVIIKYIKYNIHVVCRVVIDVVEEYGLVVNDLRSIYEINKYTY